jgi:hypothetical protein
MKMRKLFIPFMFLSVISSAQVGVNITNPTAMFHVFGNTIIGSAGGTTPLLSQDFNSAYTIVNSNNGMSGCTFPRTNGWERTTTGNTNTICTSCTGGWLWINSEQTGCGQNATMRIDFTSPPTTTIITISFDYRFNTSFSSGSFRAFLFNNTTNTQVGSNFVGVLNADADTSFSGTATVVAGNSYSIRFEYSATNRFGASVDNILVTETSLPTTGAYSFRLEDGTQANGRILTSDVDGNGFWANPTGGSGGGTDNQTLSISGNNLSISNGNTVTIPSSGGSSYTFTNGLTNTSGTVRLGGTLSQATTINLDDRDFTFTSSTTALFPGEIIYTGTNRNIMKTNFDNNYINFGNADASVDADDGGTFSDTGSASYTKDFVAGFYNGSSGGTAIATGSIEYIVDGTNELFYEGSGFSPLTNGGSTLGTSGRRWSTVYATNGTINTSDINLKIKIRPLNYGLKEILKLETISYNWKENKIGKTTIPQNLKENKIGFSAQQLKTIIPDVVQEYSWVPADEEGNFKYIKNETLGVYYSDIIPVTVKAIQEQQAQIEELKMEIKLLKEAVEMLTKK